MKDKNILICVGIIIYIAMSGIDRFVYHIPNIIYIPVAILGIALSEPVKTSVIKERPLSSGASDRKASQPIQPAHRQNVEKVVSQETRQNDTKEQHQRKEDRKQTANKSDMFQFHFFFCPFFITRLRFFSVCSVVRFDCSKVCFFVVRSAL